MTARKRRNITPGKGDIYTWIDCPYRKYSGYPDVGMACELLGPTLYFCEGFAHGGYSYTKCPRGYAR